MNKNTIVMIVMVALILISGVQAYQLAGLKTDLQDGVSVQSAPSGGAKAGASSLPTSLDNLPAMVGGC